MKSKIHEHRKSVKMNVGEKLLLILFSAMLLINCKNDDEYLDPENGENPVASINDVTINLQHIATPINGQPEASRIKYNLVNGKLYFQELTGNPWSGNAKLWEYNISANQFILKNARGETFSWSGWGTKLFNAEGIMFHIDRTSEPFFEFYDSSTDSWSSTGINNNIPGSVGYANDVAVRESSLYFLGGNFSKEFTSYAINSQQWVNLAMFPQNIERPVLVYNDGYIYSMGGATNENGGSSLVFARYSIAGNAWESLPDLNFETYFSNYGNRAVAINNRFLVTFSYGTDNSVLQIYDTQESIWKTQPLALGMNPAALFEENGQLYFITQTYHESTGTFTPGIYKAILGNLPN